MKIMPYSARGSAHEAMQIAALYHAAVHAVSLTYYTKAQLEAWAPTPPDNDFWAKRLERTQPSLCWIEGKIAGFIEWDKSGSIDCLYTHPGYQRRGVATELYHYVENKARAEVCERLIVDASKVAREFFSRQGFSVMKENKIKRNGQILVNFHMKKPLLKSSPKEKIA